MNEPGADAIDLGVTGITDATEIGAGGFGVVYSAVEADLGRTVAVKVLSGNLDEGARRRFERERRAMGTLSGHPNIVTIYQGGYTDAGHAYLTMEFLGRGSLADRLKESGPLHWEEAIKFGVQLSGALETAHRSGVLHRDIKPANILLSGLGNAKLCDFGIARLQGAPETRSAVVTASLAHAPPEIVSGQRPDAKADVYSLASTIFEFVAGQPPFVRPTDESMVPILARIAHDPVPELPPERLPAPFASVINRAMSKDPAERPDTALEFGQLLVAAQQQVGTAPTPIPIESYPSLGADSPSNITGPSATGERLPPPVAHSPHDLPPGPTDSALPDPAPTAGGPAAVPVTDSSSPVQATVIRPESERLDVSPGGGHDVPPTPPGPTESTRPGWLIPAVIAGVLALALVAGAALLLSGDDNGGRADTAAGSDNTAETADDGATEADGTPDLGDAAPDEGGANFSNYETITDDTGTISLDVPSVWDDRYTGLGTNELPLLAASPKLEDGFFGGYSEAGASVELREGTPSPAADVLDEIMDDGCSQVRRTANNIVLPYGGEGLGLADVFQGCGDADTYLVHTVYLDAEQDVTAIVKIQVLEGQDFTTIFTTITESLVIDTNS